MISAPWWLSAWHSFIDAKCSTWSKKVMQILQRETLSHQREIIHGFCLSSAQWSFSAPNWHTQQCRAALWQKSKQTQPKPMSSPINYPTYFRLWDDLTQLIAILIVNSFYSCVPKYKCSPPEAFSDGAEFLSLKSGSPGNPC